MAERGSRRIVSIVFSAGFVAAAICCALATGLALYGAAGPGNPLLYTLVIVSLVLVFALAGMAGVRLVRALTRQVGGAPTPRLHLRFVALFSFAAVTPAVLMAVFFGVLLSRGLETWFSEQVEASVDASLSVGQFYLDQIVQQTAQDAADLSADLAQDEARAVFEQGPEPFQELLAPLADFRAFTAAYVLSADGQVMVAHESPVAPAFRAPTPEEFVYANEAPWVDVDRDARVLRVLTRLQNYPIEAYLYATPDVNQALFDQLRVASNAVGTFREASVQRDRIQAFFALIYFEAALLILAGAVWLALSAAARVAGPVGRLVEAADRVRRGDLSARVEVEEEQDEVSALGRAFNLMTGQIAQQRKELVDANAESEGRRRLIEAVLLGVSAGVLSVDGAGVVRLANRSAADLLGAEGEALRDRHLSDIAPALAEIAMRARPGETVEQEIELKRDGALLVLNVRAAREETGDGRVVLTFDDITRLIAAQRNAAWRDVARRIAHEIKNPLTPIQLSAERLRRRFRPEEDASGVFDRCIETIVRQVSDIGRMVDEFSSFARMPQPRMESTPLQELAQETVFARRVASPDIRITLEEPDAPVVVRCDARLASQALTNILKNAAESIADRQDAGDAAPGRIDVRIGLRDRYGFVEIEDNGMGWPDDGRERLTEPYMTTREKGTGLGLAIVQRIMEDHDGRLDLDMPPEGARGALVRLSFPLAERSHEAEAAE